MALASALLSVAATQPLEAALEGGVDSVACATSRARSEIGEIGAAMMAWWSDQIAGATAIAAPVDALCPGAPAVDMTHIPTISAEALAKVLVPVYAAAIPELDPWGNPYDFRLDVANPASAQVIAVRSAGAGGAFEGSLYDFGFTSGPDDDLVLYNGSMIRTPPRLDPVSRQLQSVEQVNQLGMAMMAWYTDAASVTTAAPTSPLGAPAAVSSVDLSLITPISPAALAALLVPFYTPCVPAFDGWWEPYDLRLNENLLSSPVMAIRSTGSDAAPEGDLYAYEQFPADAFERDIVWNDGYFVREPTATRATIFLDGFESATVWGTWSCGPDF